ncbi:MAG: 2-hydroxyacid dehydrogenase [Desulfuromonadales bacterium]
MSLAIIYPQRDVSDWVAALQAQDPELDIEIWPEIHYPERVEFVLCWNQPAGALQQLPNLRGISSLGAGVNHLLNDKSCPVNIPLARLVDPDLKQSMAEYVMLGVLEHFRRLTDYRRQQELGQWLGLRIPHLSTIRVGVMGYGEIGRYVAHKLAKFGFKVHAWRRHRQHGDGDKLRVYAGEDERGEFLKRTEILVCLLPLTADTENILNLQTFRQLPQQAYLINAARGAHLVEADLLAALESGQLSGALLDVFRDEPLPRHHPFWKHARIAITPHIASVTNPESAALQIVENYRRALRGEPLSNRVDRGRGY